MQSAALKEMQHSAEESAKLYKLYVWEQKNYEKWQTY